MAGTVAVQESVVQIGVSVGGGLLSFTDEMKSPDAPKPLSRWILKPASVLTPPVSGIDHTVPLVAPETRVPPAYTSAPAVEVPLRVSAYVPGEGFAVGRITTAYIVPAVTVGGVPNVAVKNEATPPLLKPVIVAAARSAPVGRPPLVARMLRVRFGVVPVQPLQKRLMSTAATTPERPGVKVCPPQVVVVMPTPLVPSVVFC